MLSSGTFVRTIGLREIQLKLAAAQPALLARNRLLANSVLETIKPMVEANTPSGPAHFGYHGRDTLRIEVSSRGTMTTAKLLGAMQMFWREYGTRGRSRKLGGALGLSVGELNKAFGQGALGGGGERAFMTAHKAGNAARQIIRFYYGSMKAWWLPEG